MQKTKDHDSCAGLIQAVLKNVVPNPVVLPSEVSSKEWSNLNWINRLFDLVKRKYETIKIT
jgi:hypothetical protein